ncbi:hypothetical protein A33Q_3475 [Indibacter alkaliphilus LW1]|jgi:hypothetical protein|uniref:Uncharacterized protein n=1 Tax=Indibacter alkaliphilus (strain CCUG 57479 / KCTC 22604 / LW1) TaxID=1189612 RepID=S2DA55_INDAL|nr:hypothetical protein [Indibacter alkaliphilus]EOZ93870.1 hypothetical protein A33Q_3475 [Indibacter alkaliphilus LW1]
MNLLNYFKFVATGYVRKRKNLYGKKVYFTYRHDTEIFDPFKMILDHYYKIEQVPETSQFTLDTQFQHVKGILDQARDKKPKVIVKFSLDAGEIEIRRLVLREEKRTTSLYVIFLDEKPLAFLNKKYDYGNNIQALILENVLHGIEKSQYPDLQLVNAGCLFYNSQKEACFIEKFVHSHIFYIHDTQGYKKVCKEMTLCLQKETG